MFRGNVLICHSTEQNKHTCQPDLASLCVSFHLSQPHMQILCVNHAAAGKITGYWGAGRDPDSTPEMISCYQGREMTHLQVGSSEMRVWSSRLVGNTPELAKNLDVREALTELSHAWRSECGPHSRKVALETQRMGAGTHPLLAIAVLQILEVVVLPLRPQSHTQQREPALLGHGREVVSEACK